MPSKFDLRANKSQKLKISAPKESRPSGALNSCEEECADAQRGASAYELIHTIREEGARSRHLHAHRIFHIAGEGLL